MCVGRWAAAKRLSTCRRIKYANLGSTEMRELRQLREENAKLQRLVADLSVDKRILAEIVRKKI
jgi:putative transposase